MKLCSTGLLCIYDLISHNTSGEQASKTTASQPTVGGAGAQRSVLRSCDPKAVGLNSSERERDNSHVVPVSVLAVTSPAGGSRRRKEATANSFQRFNNDLFIF